MKRSSNKKAHLMLTYKGYILEQNPEKRNQFYFQREDGEPLTDDDDIDPMEMYMDYLVQKKRYNDATQLMYHDVTYEISEDKTVMRITLLAI